MVRALKVLLALSTLVVGVAGWLLFTSYNDVVRGDGWNLLAAARAAPWSGFPEHPIYGEVIDRRADLDATLERLSLIAERPEVDFGRSVVLRATVINSGSCPAHLDGMDVADDAIHVRTSRGFWLACSGDAVPYTFLLAVRRDRLPDVPFDLELSSDDWSWSAESASGEHGG